MWPAWQATAAYPPVNDLNIYVKPKQLLAEFLLYTQVSVIIHGPACVHSGAAVLLQASVSDTRGTEPDTEGWQGLAVLLTTVKFFCMASLGSWNDQPEVRERTVRTTQYCCGGAFVCS